MTPKDYDLLWQKIKPIKTCMFTTVDGDDLRARPMQLVQDEFDGTLYFFTEANTPKVDEAQQHREVCLSFADVEDECFVSLSGMSRVNHDKRLIDKFWNPFVAAWFPEGKDSSNVTLLEIEVYAAEYWDATANRMVQLYEIAKANVTDTEPDLGENRKFG